MRNHFNKILVSLVSYGFISAWAGSYEDFFIAIKQDNPAVIASLLQRGFDPNTRDPKGDTGLYGAIREPSFKAAEALIAWPKTDVELRNGSDESPLMMAALKGHTELVRRLLARGADVNKPGWTPLHYAATNGHLPAIRLLLENHAFINAQSPNGTTALMMAARYGTPEAVKLLLEEGAEPDLRNEKGMTAIDFAQGASREDAAKILASYIRGQQPKGKW
ncbi:MAG: ankyrin repeat domain-containing protein [Burkholderiaceae bacterium]